MKTHIEIEVEVTGTFCKAEPNVGLRARIEDLAITFNGQDITEQLPQRERDAAYELLLLNRGDQ